VADGAGRPQVLLDVGITFEAGDRLVHTPMVQAVVGGVATKLILDTGSSDHVLTRELAGEAGLPMQPAEPGTDSTGALVPSWSLGDLTLELAAHVFPLHDVVAIAGPPPFADWGVGGFLSPQHIHPTAWVVLDLAEDRLIAVEGAPSDVATWLAERSPNLRLLTRDRVPGDPTILIEAAVDAFQPVVTLLDSGGKATMFVATKVPGMEGAQGSSGRGVGGGQINGSMVEDRRLVVGDAILPVPRLFVREAMDGHDGLIGVDVLRGTVLVVSADPTRPVYWLVPDAPGSVPAVE
jgi:Aspartyl protease